MLSIFYSWPDNMTLKIILSFIISCVFGYAFFKFFRVTIGITGLVSGYFAGYFVYAMCLALTGWDNDTVCSLMTGSLATIGCYLAYKHGDKLDLGITSVIGPYFFVRGFSLIFGGYPSEIDMIRWINGGSKVSVHWMFIVYMTCFTLLVVASFMWQLN